MTNEEKCATPEWQQYVDLQHTRPELFRSGELEIITDLAEVVRFETATGATIGVRYKSDYSMLLVDLVVRCEGGARVGKPFPYERIVPAQPKGSVVAIPCYQGKFVLLRQFRHALRCATWAFPRGFAEAGLVAAENATKELSEELGCEVLSVRALGSIAPDSGMSATVTDAFYCEIAEPRPEMGYEGILEMRLVSRAELAEMVRVGEISDGFTLSALKLLEEATA